MDSKQEQMRAAFEKLWHEDRPDDADFTEHKDLAGFTPVIYQNEETQAGWFGFQEGHAFNAEQIKQLQEEVDEQCRINGMGQERELALMSKVNGLQDQLSAAHHLLNHIHREVAVLQDFDAESLMEEIEQTLNGTKIFDDNKFLNERISELEGKLKEKQAITLNEDMLEGIASEHDIECGDYLASPGGFGINKDALRKAFEKIMNAPVADLPSAGPYFSDAALDKTIFDALKRADLSRAGPVTREEKAAAVRRALKQMMGKV